MAHHDHRKARVGSQVLIKETWYYAAAITIVAANAAANAAAYATRVSAHPTNAARDDVLSIFAEAVVQILIDMKAPGTEWLSLT